MASSFNSFYRTFSGADTLVFILIPNTKPVVLGSLSTLSYSTYRIKKPVPLLNEINVSGYTKGVRTVAGTMIFTVINQHWVNDLIEAVPCLEQFDSLKPDELPLFDLLIVSANEYGASVSGTIYGVDVTDDAGVISIQDAYSENTLSFLARDIDLLKAGDNYTYKDIESKSYKYVTANSYSLNLYDDSNVKTLKLIEDNDVVKESNKEARTIEYKTIDISNIKFDEVLHELDDEKNIEIYTKSYFKDKTSVYINNVKSDNVKVLDIASSLTYNENYKSYPSFIDLIIKTDNSFIKYNLKVVGE